MTISAKLKYETSHHPDHEMREYYQARIKGYIKPSVNKKLRHETFLDYELRKLSQGQRLSTDDTYKEYIAESKMAELDSQGRHRSEWCYAPYDGRINEEKV